MTAETTAASTTADTSVDTTATTTAAATESTTPSGSDDKPQTTDTTDTTTDTATTDDKTGEATTAAVPEAYEFAMPEGMTLDQGLLDKTTPILKELGLTNEQASKLVTAYAEHMQAQGEGAAEQAEAWRAQRNAEETAQRASEWLEATKADKEIGGANFDTVKNRVIEAIGAVGTPEMKEAFNAQGWGNHPELIRLAHRPIDSRAQDRGERGAGGGGTQGGDIASRMYPDMK